MEQCTHSWAASCVQLQLCIISTLKSQHIVSWLSSIATINDKQDQVKYLLVLVVLPVQAWTLQVDCSLESPTQVDWTVLHVLSLDRVPSPHVVEQLDQLPHDSHSLPKLEQNNIYSVYSWYISILIGWIVIE